MSLDNLHISCKLESGFMCSFVCHLSLFFFLVDYVACILFNLIIISRISMLNLIEESHRNRAVVYSLLPF